MTITSGRCCGRLRSLQCPTGGPSVQPRPPGIAQALGCQRLELGHLRNGVGEGELGGDEVWLEADLAESTGEPRLGVIPALAGRARTVSAPARGQHEDLPPAQQAGHGRRVDREAGGHEMIDPRLDGARRPEVVQREPEQDGVGRTDLIDQLVRDRPRLGLGGGVIRGRHHPSEARFRVQVGEGLGAEVAVGHGAIRMRFQPGACGACGQGAADRCLGLDARIDVQEMVGHDAPKRDG
jgi:hypothetical protein